MDPLTGGGPASQPKDDSWLSKLDFGIYRVEQVIAWSSLLVMAIGYFLSILDRELTAGAGQNAFDQFVLKRMGQTAETVDPALLETIHGIWGPITAILFTLILLAAAAVTRRNPGEEGRQPLDLKRVAVFFGMSLAVFAGIIVLLLALPSRYFMCAVILVAYAIAIVAGKKLNRTLEVALVGLPVVGLLLWYVIARSGEGFAWAKSLSKVLLMWVGFVGASMATYEERNIQVDFVRKNVPAKWLRAYESIGSVVTFAFTAILALLAYNALMFAADKPTPLTTYKLHDMFLPMPIAIGFVLIGIRYVLRGFRIGLGIHPPPGTNLAPESPRTLFITLTVLAAIVITSFLGLDRGAWLVAALIALLTAGAPLYVVIGGFALACFAIWPDVADYTASMEAFDQNFGLMERMLGLAAQESLIAIPFFMIAGAIMSRGAIAGQLVRCAAAAFAWLPGGLAVSAVAACMFFAAISGSSPVTVITIGAIMLPALKKAGYPERFSLGLVTSAGSLGIIIPPSIPMIVYAIFATLNGTPVDIKHMFIAGIGPGIVIAFALGALCVWRGWSIPRSKFSFKELGVAIVDGFWALFLPAFILIGIYFGIFNAIEASAIAVILALLIEIFVHRQLTVQDLPKMLADSASLMGSILVIISVALGLSEFLTTRQIPDQIVGLLASYELTPIGFILLLNVLLLLVGCMMDIISAMILFVPLLLPLANQLGFDPIHLGLIFIVNLEIGYLTPPLGLNLFVASGFFQKPFGEVMRSVLPFIGALIVSLVLITALPTISLGLVNLARDKPFASSFPTGTVLKPVKKASGAATAFVEATAQGAGGKGASLQSVTNRSRVSLAEGTPDSDFEDFEVYAVRAYPIKEGDKHVRTVVVMTTEGENCLTKSGDGELEDLEGEEWYLRIEFPAGAKAEDSFEVGENSQVSVKLIRYEEDEEPEVVTPDSGIVVVLEAERGAEISVDDPEHEGATLGLFGAFELKFGEHTLNGKFVPSPCSDVLQFQ
ncbi:MAG: C4-dicarboxylate transporter DctM subunit [Myxococcota bacterium]